MNQTLAKVLYVAGVTTFCTFLGCWAVLAHQENTPTTKATQSAGERRAIAANNDETFLRSAAEGSMLEVKLGEVAEQRAQSEEVKKFAKRMVEDHSKAIEELKALGAREHINLPTNISHQHSLRYKALEKLSGPEFDRAYARDMVQDHQQDINEFKHGAATAQKPELKEFAQKTLPTLESHLEQAKEMMTHVSKEGGSKGRAGGAARQR
jgi:putative membrane protein